MAERGDFKERVSDFVNRKSRGMRKRLQDELDDEEFEVLDLTDRSWLQKVFKDLSKASAAKQLAVGGLSGWGTGYVFGKVGKAAALALGGSLLLMQVAHHQGYITVNWGKVEKNMTSARRSLERSANRKLPAIIEEVKDFALENVILAGGFTGGFLIGLAS